MNFQPSSADPVPGYLVDGGATYASRNGQTYGWNVDHSDVSRDRGVNASQLLDTLIHFHTNGYWEIALPNDAYQVKVSIGDTGNSSTHTINVEGVNYWNALNLSANAFANATKFVTVSDGRLTVDQGAAAEKATRINYIEIYAAPPGIASNPSPANGATQIAITPMLRWNAGSNAVSHLVYFGANSNAVAGATTSSPEFKRAQSATNYAPGTLASSGRYFWRVDEVGTSSSTNGTVWTFATLVNPADKPQIDSSYNGNYAVSFSSQIGQTYRVESTDSLSPASWQVVRNDIPGTGDPIQVEDPDVSRASQRFYRVVVVSP